MVSWSPDLTRSRSNAARPARPTATPHAHAPRTRNAQTTHLAARSSSRLWALSIKGNGLTQTHEPLLGHQAAPGAHGLSLISAVSSVWRHDGVWLGLVAAETRVGRVHQPRTQDGPVGAAALIKGSLLVNRVDPCEESRRTASEEISSACTLGDGMGLRHCGAYALEAASTES